MLKLAVCSVDDVDHYVSTYSKNQEIKKDIELRIEEIQAKLEKGAGSIIRMDGGNQRDPFKRNSQYSALYQQLDDNIEQLNMQILKIQVVDHMLMILRKVDQNGAKIAEKRINDVKFTEIAKELGISKLQVHRVWRKAVAKAIYCAKMIQYHVNP